MGIADRDYYRHQTPRRLSAGGRSPRTWSVNTWVIVICVLVFVVDGFLPMRAITMSGVKLYDDVTNVDRKALRQGDIEKTANPAVGFRRLYVDAGGAMVEVGRQDVVWMHPLEGWLHFSTQRGFFQVHFWRLVGFQFLHSHGTIWHLALNMMGLFFFGPMVERYLGSKRYLAFYLLCGICGALMYVLLNVGGLVVDTFSDGNARIPGLLFYDLYTPLIGASAGVFGVLMAGAFLAPNDTVLLFFILPIKFRILAYVLVAASVFSLLTWGANAGGEAGHLGGAIAGWYFIRHPRHLHGFFDILGRVDPTSHHYRGKGSEVRARATARVPGAGTPEKLRAEVDRILAKVNESGIHSLTAKEKRTLEKASRSRE